MRRRAAPMLRRMQMQMLTLRPGMQMTLCLHQRSVACRGAARRPGCGRAGAGAATTAPLTVAANITTR